MYRLRQVILTHCLTYLGSALSSDMYRLRRVIVDVVEFSHGSALSSDMYRLRPSARIARTIRAVFCIKQRYVSIKTLSSL